MDESLDLLLLRPRAISVEYGHRLGICLPRRFVLAACLGLVALVDVGFTESSSSRIEFVAAFGLELEI